MFVPCNEIPALFESAVEKDRCVYAALSLFFFRGWRDSAQGRQETPSRHTARMLLSCKPLSLGKHQREWATACEHVKHGTVSYAGRVHHGRVRALGTPNVKGCTGTEKYYCGTDAVADSCTV